MPFITLHHSCQRYHRPSANRSLAGPSTPQQVGAITNHQLARALLEIYIGRDPASRPAKESIGQGLSEIVLG